MILTMMSKKIFAAMSLGAIGAAVLFIVNDMKRSMLINEQRAVITQVLRDLDDYRKLGFAEDSEVIGITKMRLDRAYHRVDTLKRTRLLLLSSNPIKLAKKEQLEQLLNVDRDMVASYKREIGDYIELGISEHSKVMKFAKEKLVGMVFEIADVELRLQTLKAGNKSSFDVALNDKIQKVIDINHESIDLYKQEIKDYFKCGCSSTDRKVCFARDCIARKVAENASLEERVNF